MKNALLVVLVFIMLTSVGFSKTKDTVNMSFAYWTIKPIETHLGYMIEDNTSNQFIEIALRHNFFFSKQYMLTGVVEAEFLLGMQNAKSDYGACLYFGLQKNSIYDTRLNIFYGGAVGPGYFAVHNPHLSTFGVAARAELGFTWKNYSLIYSTSYFFSYKYLLKPCLSLKISYNF